MPINSLSSSTEGVMSILSPEFQERESELLAGERNERRDWRGVKPADAWRRRRRDGRRRKGIG